MPRPEGAPYWGESLQINTRGYNIAGSALPILPGNPDLGTPDYASTAALIYRGTLNGSAPSTTLNGGDAIQVTATPSATYLNDDDTGYPAFWVLEVLDGTGTVHMSQAIDQPPGDTAVATPTDLGTISITGAGTYTVAAPGVDARYFLDRVQGLASGFPIATIECTSGAVVLQQIKMRLWPAGGPLGEFTGRGTEDAYSSEAFRFTNGEGATDQLEGDDDETLWNDTWAATRADLAANGLDDGDNMGAINAGGGAFDKTLWTVPVRAMYRVQSQVTLTTPQYRTSVELLSTSAWIQRPPNSAFDYVIPDGVDGVDYIRQPSEVRDDPVAYAHFDTPPDVSWDPMFIENTANIISDDQVESTVLLHVAEGVWPIGGGVAIYNSVGEVGGSVVTLDCWSSVDQLIPLPMPEVQTVRLTAQHQWLFGGQPGPHGSGDGSVFNPRVAVGQTNGRIVSIVDGAPSPPRWHVEFSPFTFWVPGPAKKILPLQQFPRNDGLRGGPAGRTPGSRQAGNLLGYL